MVKTRENFKQEMEELRLTIEDTISNLLKNSKELQAFMNFRRKYFYQYSIKNTLLIHKQRPDATYVAGFNNWNEMGYKVRKGEKGIKILIPLFKKNEENDDRKTVYGYKKVTVFDVSQTEPTETAIELPQLNVSLKVREDTIYNEEQLYTAVKEVIGQYGELEECDNLGNIYGKTDGKKMWVGISEDKLVMLSTAIHEFIHFYNHFESNRKDLSKNQKETEAELGVGLFGSYFNLDISGQYNYLWMYKGNRDLNKAFEVALSTTELILYGDDERIGIFEKLSKLETPYRLTPIEAAYLMLFSNIWVFSKEYGNDDEEIPEDEWIGVDKDEVELPLYMGDYYKNWTIFDKECQKEASEILKQARSKGKDLQEECINYIKKGVYL